ncbi:HK97-gp10 family putative phage morphogenesis protein [Pseudogracilibacillus auburnensis]|uniref:HK97 gp10 family phage protein n=1 Tax=Pseudogracilibacillus auburnensis TaxID=1494959 RepID=A0A2V3W725_9BACI|nr:HK97-gp10 family putative phage morphogenesis protein [Pseudogracilibacillus auburnensis]MBO1003738.1 HK97 gp10 family phage protein [Pseudogracilibacillus auburnensis]PXW88821.1 HK97 gp10 family phage protein [Pseudogracilibacillus auburnensis]
MEFEFIGIDDLIDKLERTGHQVEQGKDEAVLEGAKVMQKATKERVPKLTRNLEMHVEISDVKDGEAEVYVEQQGKAYYGYFHEVGTSKMRARPFMGPAFNASKMKIERAIADKIRQRLMV